MKPVSETPTQPADYAVLSVGYGTALAGLAYAARDRDAVHGAELVPLAVATFALSKLVAKEKVETWVRDPFVEETAEGKRPKGEGLRYAVGELLSCTRCIGAWSALGLVGLRLASPAAARTVTSVLVASAGNDFLQSGFSWITARTNHEEARLDD